MRVLVACEFSGVVRDAFIALGHDAISCDLEPTSNPGPHYQGDVFDIIGGGYDMMIAFPPCTHIAVSGSRHFPAKIADGRQAAALEFVRRLMNADIPKIAIENPIGVISSAIRKPDQIIQPFQFGHPESKSTCLWLKGLPKLIPTNILTKPDRGFWDNQTKSGQNKLTPSPDRWKLRSKTYLGIANAMAAQWTTKELLTLF